MGLLTRDVQEEECGGAKDEARRGRGWDYFMAIKTYVKKASNYLSILSMIAQQVVP